MDLAWVDLAWVREEEKKGSRVTSGIDREIRKLRSHEYSVSGSSSNRLGLAMCQCRIPYKVKYRVIVTYADLL